MIKLRSSDGELLECDIETAKCSGTIKDMLENGMANEEDEEAPVPNVKSNILRKVLEWAEHHKNDLPTEDDDDDKLKKTDEIPQWDADFLKIESGTLFDLILAANYLNIKGLLEVTTKTLALMMKGKTPDEIREKFNIENDFTDAEKEEIRKEIEWFEEKK